MKSVNIIIYLPGYAGRFCQFLMSLHETTYPYVPLDVTPRSTDSVSRAEWYSFKNIYKKYGTWKNHHDQFNNRLLDNHNKFLNSSYKKLTFCIHPYEFYLIRQLGNHEVSQILNSSNIKYAQISTSHMQKDIEDFKLKNSNFPGLRNNEIEMNMTITNELMPYIVNLDNFFKDQNLFLSEYKSLANYFEIPEQTALALEFYCDWIEARNSIP
jgi:hypothetical protein